MIVTYAPEGQEAQVREFRPRKLMLSQITLVERTYAKLVGRSRVKLFEIEGAVLTEVPEARQLLVWFLFEPDKPIEQVDFAWDDVDVQFTKEDWARHKKRATENIMDPAELAETLAEFDARMARAPESAEGKAQAQTSSADTGSPSSKPGTSTRATRRGSRSRS